MEKGQALITLLFFVIIGITVTSAAVAIIIVNSQNATKFQQGIIAYAIAESGAENSLLRLLRDPSYTGETLTIGNGTAIVAVRGVGNAYIATSSGQIGNALRKVQVNATYSNNLLTVTSQKEIF